MNIRNNDSKAQGVLLTLAVLLSGAATLWGYVQWDALTDIALPWRNALLPLPMLVFMGMKHLQARLNGADGHE
ncbi:hypothetical protein [Serratia liquefaciens]|uniref:hypothetical protein n=1 Tax=Serratia liquefaciens TaxID=614 RepID=UPI0022B9F66B|nr:hypothetical protein [Serratia liquefaciens]